MNLKFDDSIKWFIHKPEFVLENEMHKLLRNFEIQTDQLILASRPDLKLITEKKNSGLVDFAVPVDNKIENKRIERTDKY